MVFVDLEKAYDRVSNVTKVVVYGMESYYFHG